MAGHSKWNNIKNRKGAQDKKKAKIFGQISKLIKVAVREGGSGDPNMNPGLRPVLDKARAANMPKDNIQRAIDRGLGKNSSGVAMSEIIYEGYGPGGVGMLVTAVTDNQNRTGAEVRNIFKTAGGSLGSPGSVMYMFQRSDEPSAEESFVCTMPMPVTDPAVQKQLEDLIESLQDCDDVEEVYTAGEWDSAETE